MKITDLHKGNVSLLVNENVFGDLASRIKNKTKDVVNGVGLAVKGQGANEFAKLTNMIDGASVKAFNTSNPGLVDAQGKDLPLAGPTKIVFNSIQKATNGAVVGKTLLLYLKDNKREIIKNVNVADRGAVGADQIIQLMLQGGNATAPDGFGVAECIRTIALIASVTFLHMQIEIPDAKPTQAGTEPSDDENRANNDIVKNPEYVAELKTFETLSTNLAGELYTPGNKFLADIRANNEYPAKQEMFIVDYGIKIKAKYLNADLATLTAAVNSPDPIFDANDWNTSFFSHLDAQDAVEIQKNPDVTTAMEKFKNDFDEITKQWLKLALIEKTQNEADDVEYSMTKVLLDWIKKSIGYIKSLNIPKGATKPTPNQTATKPDSDAGGGTQDSLLKATDPNWMKVKQGYDSLDPDGQTALVKALFNK